MVLFLIRLTKAQSSFECITSLNQTTSISNSSLCGINPNVYCPYWTDDGELSSYSVSASTPTLYFKVNFHFLFHPTLATTFSSITPSQLALDLTKTIDSINAKFKRCGYVPSIQIPPKVSPIVPDSKIRLLLNNIYTHTTTLATTANNQTDFKSIFPPSSNDTGFNIYFFWQDMSIDTSGYGYYSGAYDLIGVSTPLETHNPGELIKELLLWHELGHAFGKLQDYYYTLHGNQYLAANNVKIDSNPSYLPDDSSLDPATNGINCIPNSVFAQNNLMGNTSCREHLSARQIAAFHYFVAKNITKKYTQFFNMPYPHTPPPHTNNTNNITLAGTFTTNSSFIFDKVIITSGSNVTFENNVIYGINGLSKIIVQPGATLTLNGCLIKPLQTFSTNYWGGIEVWGSENVPQNAIGTQGVLTMTNSIIDRALIGVLLGQYSSFNNNDYYTHGGGWLIANKTRFTKCHISLKTADYPGVNAGFADNLTTLSDCTFDNNSIYRNLFSEPFRFVDLGKILRIKFIRCGFNGYTNDAPIPPTDLNNLSIGIKGVNSSIVVTGDPSSGFEFSQLDYAIHLTNIITNVSKNSIENMFFATKNGIYIESANNTKIVNNFFEMDKMPHYGVMNTGIYLNECDKYKIENNEFYKYNNNNSSVLLEGIAINNSGPTINQIYNNKFTRLQQGIWCQNQNFDPNNGSGLKLNCNDFINCDYAIGVQSGNSIQGLNTGIANIQGITTGSLVEHVRNSYSSTAACSNQNKFWQYTGYNIPPQVQHGNFSQTKFQVSPQPNCSFAAQINNIVGSPAPPVKSDFCDNLSALPKQKQFVLNQLTDLTNNVNTLQLQYNTLLDGNNTNFLLSQVAVNPNPGNLKNALMAPLFLSDTVLKMYFTKPNVPAGHIKQVFEKNAPASAKIYSIVMQQNLPNGIKNLITSAQNQNILSPRTNFLAKIAIAKDNQSYAGMHKAMWLIDSNTVNTKDSLSTLITLLNQGDVPKQLIELDIAYLDYDKANQKLIEYNNGLANNAQYIEFITKYIALATSTAGIHQIKTNEAQNTYINAVANNELHPCNNKAKVILSAVYGTYYPEVKLSPFDNNGTESRKAELEGLEEILVATKLADGISLYPNPAQNAANLNKGTDYIYTVKISNVNGQMLSDDTLMPNSTGVINTSNLPNGIYFVNLFNGKQLIKVAKLIIAK